MGEIDSRKVRAKILNALIKANKKLKYRPYNLSMPESMAFERYFPHMNFDSRTVMDWVKENVRKVKERDGTNVDVIRTHMEGIHSAEMGNPEVDDTVMDYSIFFEDKPVTPRKITDMHPKAWQMQFRSRTNPTPGWSTDIKVLQNYERKMSKFYFTAVNAFLQQRNIGKFKRGEFDTETKNWSLPMADKTEAWANFMSMYNYNVSGRPSLIPNEWINDENMSLKNNPYMLFTNQFWKEKGERIARKYFDRHPFYKDLPEITMAEYNGLDDNVKQKLQSLINFDFDRKVTWLSNVDAKWNMISLLTHTKTMVNNLIGGHTNTLTSTGLKHWLKSGDLEYLKKNIFVDFNSWEDVTSFIEQNGGIESMFKTEFNLSGRFDKGKFKDFKNDILNSFKEGEKLDEERIRAKANRHKIADDIFDTAGWFMRKSEVMLRSKSWLSHYLQAREVLSANGLDVEANHPWLIDWANKGVATTQFMYNNANRPAFARTALGKIYSRFQLFAWKSIAFRKDLYTSGS